MIEIIDNFFNTQELDTLLREVEKNQWKIGAQPKQKTTGILPAFWFKDLYSPEVLKLFTNKIESGIGRKIVINKLYANGQAHGQCSFWHTDVDEGSINCFTVIYFLKEWLPEYGGHLLLKTEKTISIIPEFNKAVLFDSTIEHMGMDPTMHCKTQRESIACKFKVIV
jgi:hypothetical protein